MDGFLYWGFWDGSLFADISPFYDRNWKLRGAGKVYQDLVYNKWWTREEGKTNSRGRYNLSAYYGDYDIVVTTSDGYEKTVSVPLNKNEEGYNVVDITPSISNGKLNVAIDFVNKIRRSGIDYTVYTAIYNERGNLISMSRVNKTSTGDQSEEINLKDITLKSNAYSGKIIVWLNNGKMIPLSGAKEFNIGIQ